MYLPSSQSIQSINHKIKFSFIHQMMKIRRTRIQMRLSAIRQETIR